ncbi:MAG: histidine phosphatase family protein [Bacilli bacterium]|nr:histidine phosphatase family protein [Bacilli bacterium]MDD3304783.1 histidine phosphatase family protein [Bacilli bacterium]MDD4053805.1 histidine phosphatase family protein [Bacilli bacterium]MDD4411621.1 histidine phosphatase family protein [Bacilli bacterium]
MIYLLRHGLDDEEYIGGWSAGDLTEEGKKQVQQISKFIALNNLDIEQIYSSDIKRAVSSSEIIGQELKLKPIYVKELRELDKGDLTGLLIKDAKRMYHEYFDNLDIYTRYPNGECMLDLYKRVKHLFTGLLEKDKTLIITHRGVINMVYFLLNDIPLDMNKERFGVTHASLHEIDPTNKLIRKLNNIGGIK